MDMFETYTMVSEIHNNVDLVLGIKTFLELEGEISMRGLILKFLNRANPKKEDMEKLKLPSWMKYQA